VGIVLAVVANHGKPIVQCHHQRQRGIFRHLVEFLRQGFHERLETSLRSHVASNWISNVASWLGDSSTNCAMRERAAGLSLSIRLGSTSAPNENPTSHTRCLCHLASESVINASSCCAATSGDRARQKYLKLLTPITVMPRAAKAVPSCLSRSAQPPSPEYRTVNTSPLPAGACTPGAGGTTTMERSRLRRANGFQNRANPNTHAPTTDPMIH